MIIENVVGPEMINTILLSHLLFINSRSAIIAQAEMKGEGRAEQLACCRCYKKGEGMEKGGQKRVLISVAVIYILIKSVFGSWP